MSSWRGDVGYGLYFQTSAVPNTEAGGKADYTGLPDTRKKTGKAPGVSSRQERSVHSRGKEIKLKDKPPWET